MPAAWTITYRGSKLIDAGEGTQRFHPGLNKPTTKSEVPARARGKIIKHLNTVPPTHSLKIVFDNVALSEVLGIWARLQNFLDPPTSGALVMPVWGTFPRCVLTEIEPDEPTATLIRLTSASQAQGSISASNKGLLMAFTLTFEQLSVHSWT